MKNELVTRCRYLYKDIMSIVTKKSIWLIVIILTLTIMFILDESNYLFQKNYFVEDEIIRNEKIIDESSGVDTIEKELQTKQATLELEMLYLMESDISRMDYRADLFLEYMSVARKKIIVEALMDGVGQGDIASAFYLGDTRSFQDELALDEQGRVSKINEANQTLEYIEELIVENDYRRLQQFHLSEAISVHKKLEADIEEATRLLALEETGSARSKELENEISYLEQNKVKYELLKVLYDYASTIEEEYDQAEWKYKTIEEMINRTRNAHFYILTDDDHESYAEFTFNESYDEYVLRRTHLKEEYEEFMQRASYSLKQNKPLLEIRGDARVNVMSTMHIFIVISCIYCICIGGNMVSKEIEIGKLRPLYMTLQDRMSVIIKKYLTLILISIGIMCFGLIFSIIVWGILLGFDSYIPTVIIYENNTVMEQPYLQYLVLHLGMDFLSVALIAAIITCFSSLIEQPRHAIFLTFLIYFGGVPVNLYMLKYHFLWKEYTFIPYIGVSLLDIISSLNKISETQYLVVQNDSLHFLYSIIGVILCLMVAVCFTKKVELQ